MSRFLHGPRPSLESSFVAEIGDFISETCIMGRSPRPYLRFI